MPGAPRGLSRYGFIRCNATHAVREQIDIARPAQRQHQRREESRTNPQKHGAGRGPSHPRKQDQGSDRDPGHRRPNRQRPHVYVPASKRW
jgi:hypothetical protein